MESNNRQTQLILDAIPSLIFLKDTSNRILRVNQAVLDAFDLRREEVEGCDSKEIFPDQAEAFYQDDLEVIRSGQPKTGYPERAGDRWVRTDKIPIRNDSGEVHRLLVVATDITDLKLAEDIQKKARRQLEITGRLADVGGWELDVASGGLKWSEQVYRIHDAPADYTPTVEEAISFYEPESREEISRLVQQATEAGEPWDTELLIRTQKDRLVWVRAIGEAELIDGECVRLWGTLQDITKRKQREEKIAKLNIELERRANEAEEARHQAELAEAELGLTVKRLTDSEERYRTLFEKSPTMHANVNADDGTLKDCNGMLVQRLGYADKSELIGRHILSLYSESCQEEVQKAFEQFVETGEVKNESLRLLTRDGKEIPVILNVASIRDAEGNILYSSSTWSDVTELTRANYDLNEFAYVASHDLKAPLRAINHLATWLEDDLKGTLNSSSEQHLAQLKQRVTRMERLLDDLLAFSRAGLKGGQVTLIDLGDLVTRVADLYGEEEHFTICLDLVIRKFQACSTPLETILRNLISNAIKHHDQGHAQITIESRLVNNRVEIAVSDNGPGIPRDMRERAFRMFHTLRPRDEVEGSGMGLALAKRLVESAGGSITIDSVEPHGTKILFAWPLCSSCLHECDDRLSN